MMHRRLAVLPLLVLSCAACTSGGSQPAAQTTPGGGTVVASTIPPPEIGQTNSQPPATLPPPPTSPPTTSVELATLACIRQLPLATRVGQVVWPATDGSTLTRDTKRFAEWGVGGAVVMSWPDGSPLEELKTMKSAGRIPLLLGTDEEGGTVQRFRIVGALPSAAEVARTMKPEEARSMIADHGVYLKAAGIDVVFGPVVDVAPLPYEQGGDADNSDNSDDGGSNGGGSNAATGRRSPLGDRVFGTDPVLVDAYALAYVDGWEDADLLPVVKHFPGHGAASGDTHDGIATTPLLSKLRQRDLLPYADIVKTKAGVMVGHLDVPDLTDEEQLPASLSERAITGLLRQELGFTDALVFTDALGMKAITDRFPLPQAAEMAIAAGADVALFTNTDDTPKVIARLVDAVESGRLDEARLDDAVSKVLRQKEIDPCSPIS